MDQTKTVRVENLFCGRITGAFVVGPYEEGDGDGSGVLIKRDGIPQTGPANNAFVLDDGESAVFEIPSGYEMIRFGYDSLGEDNTARLTSIFSAAVNTVEFGPLNEDGSARVKIS